MTAWTLAVDHWGVAYATGVDRGFSAIFEPNLPWCFVGPDWPDLLAGYLDGLAAFQAIVVEQRHLEPARQEAVV